MSNEQQERILNKASDELWKAMEAILGEAAEDMVQEDLSGYLGSAIPQEVLDLSVIYDTYLKDSVVHQIQDAERRFTRALCLRTLLKGLDHFGFQVKPD